MGDTVQSFLLPDLNIRGVIVSLDGAWQTVISRRQNDPQHVEQWLGQATVSALLMSANIKFDGKLTLQIESKCRLSLLAVQCDNHFQFRATAKYDNPSSNLTEAAKGGLVGISIHVNKDEDPYQGVVSVESDVLADNLENYFAQSEQLKTVLKLDSDKKQAAGILLQAMPNCHASEDDWNRLRHLIDTLSLEECQRIDSQTLIGRLFAEDEVVVYPEHTATFHCHCSDERTLAMLTGFDEHELQEIVDSGENVSIYCDFCGQVYHHDTPTIIALLANKKHPN